MARVLISMKDDFLKQIDEVAESEQRSRSELIREALRQYIRKNVVAQNPKVEQEARALESLLES
ncbi:MAG: ribbon-helix-helix protein, CopG family [Cyanobacteria bacterium HKST-UBA06]|nr:ribbon-helix-helix protein, CopG family [Cyanobacteria bacterium HKST-UBA04]MCA9807421.1 ribbon-helix-helix protein, CopG family [Cyanobacteria bacterium HKST-UBA06]